MCTAIDAFDDPLHSKPLLCHVTSTQRYLRLNLDGCERRLQLVRRIGGECSFPLYRTPQLDQKMVDRIDERPHLDGRTDHVDGLQFADVARANSFGQYLEWRETLANT